MHSRLATLAPRRTRSRSALEASASLTRRYSMALPRTTARGFCIRTPSDLDAQQVGYTGPTTDSVTVCLGGICQSDAPVLNGTSPNDSPWVLYSYTFRSGCTAGWLHWPHDGLGHGLPWRHLPV